jgi:hypothetical protein
MNQRSRAVLVVCLVGFFFPNFLFAQSVKPNPQKKVASQYRLPSYGMAGCGWGSLAIPSKKENLGPGLQISAATSNEFPSHLPLSSSSLRVTEYGGFFAADAHGIGVIFLLFSSTSAINQGGVAQGSSIASQSSGCGLDETSHADKSIEQLSYLAINFESIHKEAVQGHGDNLQGFAEIIGCGRAKQYEHFAQATQNLHAEIFSDAVPENVILRWKKSVRVCHF